MNYLNMLMSNSIAEISKDNQNIESNNWMKLSQTGGNNSVPHGGFPPIIPIKKDKVADELKYKKEREFTSHKGSVSIKQIMENKKNISRFIKNYV